MAIVTLPIKPIIQHAAGENDLSAGPGLCRSLRSTIRESLIETDKRAPVSEQAVREAINFIDTEIDFINYDNQECNVFESLSAGDVQVGLDTVLRYNTYFNPIEISGEFTSITLSGDLNVIFTKAEPLLIPDDDNFIRTPIEGGRNQYSITVPESGIDISGYTLFTLSSGDVLGKAFIKCLTGMADITGVYSIGTDTNTQLLARLFNFDGTSGIFENWEYGTNVITSGYYYADQNLENVPIKIYCHNRDAITAIDEFTTAAQSAEISAEVLCRATHLTGSVGVSWFYDRIDWTATVDSYMLGNLYNKGIEKINFDQDIFVGIVNEPADYVSELKNYAAVLDEDYGYIYIAGGITTSISNEVHLYKPHQNVFSSTVTTLAVPAYSMGRGVIDGNMYFCGGLSGTVLMSDSIQYASFLDLTFAVAGTFSTGGRTRVGSTSYENEIYIFGGDRALYYTSGDLEDSAFVSAHEDDLTDEDLFSETGGVINGLVDFIETYNPLEETTALRTSVLTVSRSDIKTFTNEGMCYLINGETDTNALSAAADLPELTQMMEKYDMAGDIISVETTSPLFPVGRGSTSQSQEAGYYFGGVTKFAYESASLTEDIEINVIQKFDFITKVWSIGNARLINTISNTDSIAT